MKAQHLTESDDAIRPVDICNLYGDFFHLVKVDSVLSG